MTTDSKVNAEVLPEWIGLVFGNPRRLAALAMALCSVPAWSTPISLNQTLEYEYRYSPRCTAFDSTGACTSSPDPIRVAPQTETNNSLPSDGQTTLEAFAEGTDLLDAIFNIDVDNGARIKSTSELRLQAINGATEEDDVLVDIKLRAENRVRFTDTVTTDDPDGEIFRFQTVVTGSIFTIENYGTDGGVFPNSQSLGTIGSRVHSTVTISAGIGSAPETEAENGGRTFAGGFTPDGSLGNIETNKPVDMTLTYLDILNTGSTAQFSFDFNEMLIIEANGLDVGRLLVFVKNDLGNTITTYASVFDAAGNLLPDARVESSFGFTYAPLPQFGDAGSVPAPPVALLLATGLLGLLLGRRGTRDVADR